MSDLSRIQLNKKQSNKKNENQGSESAIKMQRIMQINNKIWGKRSKKMIKEECTTEKRMEETVMDRNNLSRDGKGSW